MNNFHERLKEERTRLGLNQTQFGEVGGVRKETQSLYESGKRSPDADYLARIAQAGADVTYILTGVRQPLTPPVEAAVAVAEQADNGYGTRLSRRELALIENLRECGEEDRRLVEQLALRVSETKHREVGHEELRKAS